MQKQNVVECQPKEQTLIKLITELINKQNPLLSKWLPRYLVKDFLGYEDTQMSSFQKRAKLVTAKVGKRTFYSTDSIIEFLNSSAV